MSMVLYFAELFAIALGGSQALRFAYRIGEAERRRHPEIEEES